MRAASVAAGLAVAGDDKPTSYRIEWSNFLGGPAVIAAQTGISGSTKIGNNCMIGGQVGIVGHIKLADGTRIGAQSGISKSVEEKGKALRGSPAQDYKLQLRSEAVFRNLDALDKRLHHLEKEIANRHL